MFLVQPSIVLIVTRLVKNNYQIRDTLYKMIKTTFFTLSGVEPI